MDLLSGIHGSSLDLLELLWDEQALQAEVDRIRDLTNTPEEDLAQLHAGVKQIGIPFSRANSAPAL